MRVKGILCAALLFVLSLSAHADSYFGTAYRVPASTANNVPTQGNVPGPGASVAATFNASQIQFSGDDGKYSLGGFLNSFGSASNIAYQNGFDANSDLTNTLFEFTGVAYFQTGQVFNVFHDDGVNLYVNGTSVLAAPSTTAPINTAYTYNGPTGNFNFDFIYANGPPTQADFQTNLVPVATPEPSSLALLGTGLLSAVGVLRRRVTKS